jgi:biotin transport system substrate-specific component
MTSSTSTTVSPARGRAASHTIIGVIGFAVALAAASQVAIPVPGTPVPITLQPLLVVLAGLWLGPVAGAASMVLYLLAGAAGLPVFAPIGAPGVARLLGPTGGYLIAYPVAAFVAGWLGLRAAGLPARVGAAAAGILVMYVGGLAQLAILTGSLTTAAVTGVLPFVALDAVKAIVAGLLAPRRAAPAAT